MRSTTTFLSTLVQTFSKLARPLSKNVHAPFLHRGFEPASAYLQTSSQVGSLPLQNRPPTAQLLIATRPKPLFPSLPLSSLSLYIFHSSSGFPCFSTNNFFGCKVEIVQTGELVRTLSAFLFLSLFLFLFLFSSLQKISLLFSHGSFQTLLFINLSIYKGPLK